MAKRQPRTLLEVCVARLGVHKGALAAAWIAQWALTARELGHFPSTAEYAEWWYISDRNAWRHRAAMVKALGDEYESIVLDIAKQLDARMSRREQINVELATA